MAVDSLIRHDRMIFVSFAGFERPRIEPVCPTGSRLELPAYLAPHLEMAMLDLLSGFTRTCEGMSRRSFLRVGALAGFGVSLPLFLKAKSCRPRRNRRTSTAS